MNAFAVAPVTLLDIVGPPRNERFRRRLAARAPARAVMVRRSNKSVARGRRKSNEAAGPVYHALVSGRATGYNGDIPLRRVLPGTAADTARR